MRSISPERATSRSRKSRGLAGCRVLSTALESDVDVDEGRWPVIDGCSRRVVGRSIADHMRTELVGDATEMATWRRRPSDGAIAHSDHRSNFCSWVFGQRFRPTCLLGSMGVFDDALDNAIAESLCRVAAMRSSRPPLMAHPRRTRPGQSCIGPQRSATRLDATPGSATSSPSTSRPPMRHDKHPITTPSGKRDQLHGLAASLVMPSFVVNAGWVIEPRVIVNTDASIDHDCVVGSFAHVAPWQRFAAACRSDPGCSSELAPTSLRTRRSDWPQSWGQGQQ